MPVATFEPVYGWTLVKEKVNTPGLKVYEVAQGSDLFSAGVLVMLDEGVPRPAVEVGGEWFQLVHSSAIRGIVTLGE